MKSQTMVKPVNVLEMAMDEGSINMFVQAVQGTDLNSVLAGEGPFTVLAPTDDAFRQFSSQSINELLSDKDELTTLISHHIIPGNYAVSDLKKMGTVKTLLGSDLNISNVNFIESDIEGSNGCLNVIGNVLIPK